jgi:hypothetical protein
MENFVLTIELGNSAMQTKKDIANSLFYVSRLLRVTEEDSGQILDNNGNNIGKWEIYKDETLEEYVERITK